jgi:hypothetical protein
MRRLDSPSSKLKYRKSDSFVFSPVSPPVLHTHTHNNHLFFTRRRRKYLTHRYFCIYMVEKTKLESERDRDKTP